jgi:predicted transposase YdaD
MFSLYEYDYKSHLKSEHDDGFEEGQAQGIAIGEERGIAIGEERGELKKLASIATNMQNNGYSLDQVSDITGVAIADIQKALDSVKNTPTQK